MTTSTQTQTLKSSFATYGHTAALKDGSIKPRGIEFDLVELSPITVAFRRMCRNLEFDISEMAITTYLTAKAHDLPFTAIPAFVVRQFWHSPIAYNVKSGVTTPKDLEGKKVGVRAYTVTGGVWARGILAHEYGVDLDKVDWVLVDEEHVGQYKAPGNVSTIKGGDMGKMLAEGEIVAAIGAGPVDSPDVKPLIADPLNTEVEWFKRTGIYPINHTVVVKNDLLAREPWVADELFAAFKQAKAEYLPKLKAGTDLDPADQILADRLQYMDDPLPYGIEANRHVLETIISYAHEQHILPREFNVEEVFAKSTLNS